MPKWRRILTWFAIAVAVVATYAMLFGFQTGIVLEARHFARKSPAMWKVPVELVDASISKSPGEKLSYLGCEFEVPWNDLDKQKTRFAGKWQFIYFQSGKRIIFRTFPANARVDGITGSRQKRDPESIRKVRDIYGDETLRSDYAFTRAMLEMTPGNISIFGSRREAFRDSLLLLLKPMTALGSDSGIYNIQTKAFRGFQYGNPQNRPSEIVDELFSDHERIEFQFLDCNCKGCDAKISQAEINRVIQTARIVH